MKKRISKAFALVLTVLMLLSVLPATAVMAAPLVPGRVVTVAGITVYNESYPASNYRNNKVPGVSFNPANNTVTLNSFRLGSVEASTNVPGETMDLTVVVNGKCSAGISTDGGNLNIVGNGELNSGSITAGGILTISNAKVTAYDVYAKKGVVVNTGSNGSLVVNSNSAMGAIRVGVGAAIAISGKGVRIEGAGPIAQPTKRSLKAKIGSNCKTVKAFTMRYNTEVETRKDADGKDQEFLVNVSATKFPYVAIQPVAKKLKMDKTSKIMFPGQRYVASAVSFPYFAANTKLTFTSSNQKVATVDKATGEVTAISAGSAKITAKNGEGKKGVTTITVGAALPQNTTPVGSVELNKNQMDLSVRQSYTLKTSIYPKNATNTKLIWESSDPAVATVNNKGKVTAKSAGTCTISVQTVEGGRYDTCSVYVY